MFGVRSLLARVRIARATADFRRCKDEWNEAYRRQDTRRMRVAGANLRAARRSQLAAELAMKSLTAKPLIARGGQ